jgi:hypothetical protein
MRLMASAAVALPEHGETLNGRLGCAAARKSGSDLFFFEKKNEKPLDFWASAAAMRTPRACRGMTERGVDPIVARMRRALAGRLPKRHRVLPHFVRATRKEGAAVEQSTINPFARFFFLRTASFSSFNLPSSPNPSLSPPCAPAVTAPSAPERL